MSDSCVFCAIVGGTAEASIVAEEGTVMAFLDLHPVNPGHVLVVPRVHASGLTDLDPDVGADLFRLAHRLTDTLRRSEFGYIAFNLLLADGATAGQEVFHTHLHVIPREAGDRMRVTVPSASMPRQELDRVASALRRAL